MGWRPHGRAGVSRYRPEAWAICDDCGFLYNRINLQFQYEWFGARLQNTQFLKCVTCLDKPQEQLRVIVLPSDPVPIWQPRPELYVPANNPIGSIGTPIGSLTAGASLAAIADSNTNKPFFLSAVTYVSTTTNTVGYNWTGLTTNDVGIVAGGFTAYAPNNAKLFGGGAASYTFQGSSNNSTWTTLISGTSSGGIGEILTATSTNTTTPYLYHQLAITGDNVNSVSVAQLQVTSLSAP